ncbi:MAG: hypothetical protein ACTHMJ_13375 [Thermomicrobiales bacterium]
MSATQQSQGQYQANSPAPSQAAGGAVPLVDFNGATRRKVNQLATVTKVTGASNVSSFNIPRVGYVGRIWLAIRGTASGTITAPNGLGFASIIRNINVQVNSGLQLYNSSGAGFHYLLRPFLDFGQDPFPQSNARSAVSAAAFNLDMMIPLMLNFRDPIGLILAQSEATLLTVNITWESDSVVGTGATVNATVVPYVEFFTVPSSDAAQPPRNTVHQILEDQISGVVAGPYPYVMPRGGLYLMLLLGYGMGVSGADNFSQVQLRAAQSDYIQSTDTAYLDLICAATGISRQRLLGTAPLDFAGTSGLGTYDLMRDTIDTSRLTDMTAVVQATTGGTLYAVRRQLLQIPG